MKRRFNRENQRGASERQLEVDIWDNGSRCGTWPAGVHKQNLDFSTFPLLLKVTYDIMGNYDHQFRRRLPFAVYQHAMTCYLSAALLDAASQLRFADAHSLYKIIKYNAVPEVIKDYISSACDFIRTRSGDEIKLNLPEIAIPKSDTAGHCGAFGDVNARTHNAYECYMSPFVTWRLIERTKFCNENDAQWGAWNPFVEDSLDGQATESMGYYKSPKNSKATLNLLGYREPERLHPDALENISKLTCATSDNCEGKLRYSHNVQGRVGSWVRGSGIKIFVEIEKFYKPPLLGPTKNLSSIAVRTTETVPNDANLAEKSVEVYAYCELSPSEVNKAHVFGLKRERTKVAPGPCFIKKNDEMITGWAGTMNHNFMMEGDFASTRGAGSHFLRERLHCAGRGSRYWEIFNHVEHVGFGNI